MSKILLKINNDNEFAYPVDGYVLGLNKFSILFEKTFSLEEIVDIIKNTDKEVYVSLNRVIYNDELKEYKEILLLLDNIGLSGIIIGDLAAFTYNLKTNLIIDQLHLNNSYYAINHYYDNGAYGSVITNDITLKEINEIKANSKAKLYKQVFGLEHLSTSVRRLVSNYLESFNINYNCNSYLINEPKDDNYYPIIEDYFGTHILSSKVLNLLSILDDLKTDYNIIDMYMLNKEKENLIIDSFVNNKKDNVNVIDKLYDTTSGFINKETIYKVKNNE